LNNFVYSIAEDLVRISDSYFRLAVDYRYKISIPNEINRMKIVPEQRTPEKFDLLTSNFLAKEIGEVKDANINSVISSELEVEYAGKKFYDDPEVREKVKAILRLDPMNGVSEDDKMIRVQSSGISRLTYVTSSNISALVEQAIEDSAGAKQFLTLKIDEQRKIISVLALEKMKEIDQQGIQVPGVGEEGIDGPSGETYNDLPVQKGKRGSLFITENGKRTYLQKDEAGSLKVVQRKEQ